MPKSMGKGAASPSKFLMLQQKSPGLAQNEWKEHPSKLMGQQRRGTASCVDAKRLMLLTGQKDVREFTELRRSQRGAGLCGGAPVLHPQELRRESHWGHPCCGEGPGAVDGLAWQGHPTPGFFSHGLWDVWSIPLSQLWVTPAGAPA